jgi:hypothetical protein
MLLTLWRSSSRQQQQETAAEAYVQAGRAAFSYRILLCVSVSLHCPGHQCVHTVSELKQGAVISDFELLTSNIQDVYMDLQRDTYSMTR